jgi:ASPM-SPD-2-Hydin domain-containing protein
MVRRIERHEAASRRTPRPYPHRRTCHTRLSNSGTGMLTVTGMTGPCGSSFSVNWTSGTISAGASQAVSFRFAPTSAQNCTGVVTVNGDQTSGTNTIAMVANAVAGFSRDLTGRWRGAVGADTIITLTQTASSLSGTFDSVSLKGTVSGSVSNTGQVTLTVTVPGFQPFTLTGQADAAGNTISGQVNGSGFQNEAFTLRRL